MTLISSTATSDDPTLDTTLRPQGFGEYIGQEKIKRNLRIFIDAARKREEPVELREKGAHVEHLGSTRNRRGAWLHG